MPFNARFDGKNAIPRELLLSWFAEERSGILNRLIAGFKDQQINGLGFPQEISESTMNFRAEMDTIAQWIEEKCVIEQGVSEDASYIYQSYADFCRGYNQFAYDGRAFQIEMRNRGFERKRAKTGEYRFVGIRTRIANE